MSLFVVHILNQSFQTITYHNENHIVLTKQRVHLKGQNKRRNVNKARCHSMRHCETVDCFVIAGCGRIIIQTVRLNYLNLFNRK